MNKKQLLWKSEANLETFQKRFLYIGVSYKYVSKSVKSLKSDPLSNRILVQGFIVPNLDKEYKTIFPGKRSWL